MLSIQDLKAEAYLQWETLLFEKGAFNSFPMTFEVSVSDAERFPLENSDFKSEIRKRFGDLRRRSTWEAAVISLTAHGMAQSFLEPYQVIGFMVSPDYMDSPIRKQYGEQLIEEMLKFPEVLDLVCRGLEQIYREDFLQERDLVEKFIAEGKQLPAAIALTSSAITDRSTTILSVEESLMH